MSKKKDSVDGGYGFIGDSVTYMILEDITDDEVREAYLNDLKKEDEEAYAQFMEWYKFMKK